jgi:hypothetical protein
MNEALADEGTSPLGIVGGLVLWTLRLILAPVSTLSGFRSWVLDERPVAPGRRASTASPVSAARLTPNPGTAISGPRARRTPGPGAGPATKTQRFMALVVDRYGPLADFPITNVSKVCTELAPEVDLNAGAARTALRRYVQAAQNGSKS